MLMSVTEFTFFQGKFHYNPRPDFAAMTAADMDITVATTHSKDLATSEARRFSKRRSKYRDPHR